MEAEDDSSTSSEELPNDSDNDSDDSQSASDLEPDSEDEGLVKRNKRKKKSSGDESDSDLSGDDDPDSVEKLDSEGNDKSAKETKAVLSDAGAITRKQETTRSLAFQLLDMDVGYSSDEGGDEDTAHYFDGVDVSFTPFARPSSIATSTDPVKSESQEVTTNPDDGAVEPDEDTKEKNEPPQVFYPVKKDDFSLLGKSSQLQVAIALTNHEPDPHDFDNFPNPSQKEIEAAKVKAEEEARALEEQRLKEEAALIEAQKPKIKSTTKVEQVSTISNEVVHVWASAEDAAAIMVSIFQCD
jgi:hypothetical protein